MEEITSEAGLKSAWSSQREEYCCAARRPSTVLEPPAALAERGVEYDDGFRPHAVQRAQICTSPAREMRQ